MIERQGDFLVFYAPDINPNQTGNIFTFTFYGNIHQTTAVNANPKD